MQNFVASSANSWCDFRLLERQQTYDYCLWTSTLKYVIIMNALANHNSFWTYSLGVSLGALLGMKIKPFTQLERFFVTHVSTSHENSDCSDLSGSFSCDQTMRKAGADFRSIDCVHRSADSGRTSFETNPFVHAKEEITASYIVCCFKHSSSMLWVSKLSRKSYFRVNPWPGMTSIRGQRAALEKDFKPPWKKGKIQTVFFFIMTCWGQEYSDTKPFDRQIFTNKGGLLTVKK